MERQLAKIGVAVISVSLILPAWLSATSAPASAVMVASAVDRVPDLMPRVDRSDDMPALPELSPLAHGPSVAVAAGVHEAPPAEPLVLNGVVTASWYGPGFYGNRTACGQTFSPEIVGVAHRTLACGTQVQVTSPNGVTLVVPVIDRGPFVAGRSLDLSSALRSALRCSDLCAVQMVVLDR